MGQPRSAFQVPAPRPRFQYQIGRAGTSFFSKPVFSEFSHHERKACRERRLINDIKVVFPLFSTMPTIHIAVHPLPGTVEDLHER